VNWLKDNSFLAGWLALPVTIFAVYAQNKGKPIREIDWTWAIIFMTFGVTLGVAFTPSFDSYSREFAKWLATLSFFAILFNRRRDN
jgi:membrane protein DedA with SNARE-associated domain